MKKIELNKNWFFRNANVQKSYSATVPGTVHTDLLANKLIDDPFYGDNELKLQWIDKEDWVYESEFEISKEILDENNIDMVFKGLDTYAEVSLNNQLILNSENMFLEYRVECKKILKIGKNSLKIYFKSPINETLPKLEKLAYNLPAINDHSEDGGLEGNKLSVFSRKAPYHYGWDWGPRFVTSGIWRPIYLEAWSGIKISDVRITTEKLTQECAVLNNSIELNSDSQTRYRVEIYINNYLKSYKEFEAKAGMQNIDIKYEIENPKLWWTNGLGESYLYKIETKIRKISAEKIIAEDSKKYGIRDIKVIREKDEYGKSFRFELNGKAVFIKGANHIPNDNFLSRVSKDIFEREIKDAVDANMNMLRVWGGGVYEEDYFYELCDEYGILVWQDFMFACSMYPGDSAFLDNIRQEAIYNIKRLRNHASMAIWCGNNEMDTAWSERDENAGWGWKDRYDSHTRKKIWNDYEKIFHELLPELVKSHNSKTFYWPSSPMTDYDEHSTYTSTSGDIHYWGVWHGEEPYENYETFIGRFMSEYGLQSFPELSTVKTYTDEHELHIDSKATIAHQKQSKANRLIKQYMQKYYGEFDNFTDFIFLSQVSQAKGVKIALEAHRRSMKFCGGTLYWQINDCWPVASWSSIDYYGKWKALHYAVRDAYTPILLSITQEKNKINKEAIQIYVVSDYREEKRAKLKIKIMSLNGEIKREIEKEIIIKALTSEVYFHENLDKLIENKNSEFIYAAVESEGEILSKNIYFLVHEKDLKLEKTNIKFKTKKIGAAYEVEISSEKYVKALFLSTNIEGKFSDNYFDLLPGLAKKILFKTLEEVEDFAQNITYTNYNDIKIYKF